MPLLKLVGLGALILLGMVGWAWIRSQRSNWIRRHSAAGAWILAAMVVLFIALLLRIVGPKL